MGKTTLARLMADGFDAQFIAISAVLGGVKDIRDAVTVAQVAQGQGRRTILFVDEVHRFNKVVKYFKSNTYKVDCAVFCASPWFSGGKPCLICSHKSPLHHSLKPFAPRPWTRSLGSPTCWVKGSR